MYLINEEPITAEEESRLIPLAQAGDLPARNRLVSGNLRGLMVIAAKIRGRIELDDAVNEMAIVLMLKSIPKFKPGKQRLLSYATSAFRWRLNDVAHSRRPVPITSAMVADLRKSEEKPGTQKYKKETLAQVRQALGARQTNKCDRLPSSEDPMAESMVKEAAFQPDANPLTSWSSSRGGGGRSQRNTT